MKKQTKILIMILLVLSLTGCTKQLKSDDKKLVRYSETKQVLTKNILCLPEDEQLLEVYKDYNENNKSQVDLENLVECTNLKVTKGAYEGVWTSIFVKPLAVLIIKLGQLVKSYGFALIIATILIRAVVWPFTGKAAVQSENMKLAQPELNKLEKKYANKQDQDSMMQKSQEMMLIYKKYNINPMTSCLFAFIQIPLFFAFYEAISRIPVIFEETFLGFQLGTSPLTAVMQGKYYYLIFIILIAGATYYSFKLNSAASSANQEQASQMKNMTLFMVVFMTIASFSISSGIAIYWVTSNLITIAQNLLVKKRGKKNA